SSRFAEERDHKIARRHNIGFDDVINGSWAFRAVTCDQIIGTSRCSHLLHGPDGNHVRIVARSCDRTVTAASCKIVAAVITSGHDHDNTGFPSLLDSLAQGIDFVALVNGSS